MNERLIIVEYEKISDFKPLEWVEEIFKLNTIVLIIDTSILEMDDSGNALKVERIFDERKFVDGYKIDSIFSRKIINSIFSIINQVEEKNIIWEYNKFGKPYIENNYNIEFNISHSFDLLIIGFRIGSIGLDIQYIDKTINCLDILNLIGNEEEKNIIIMNDYIINFFKYWVAKEAYLKFKGDSIFFGEVKLKLMMISNNQVVFSEDDEIIELDIMNIKKDYIMCVF